MKEYNLELFADYFQFYISDENSESNLGEYWTDFAVENMIAFADGIIGIGTARNMDVPVKLQILNSEPEEDNFKSYDKVNECDLDVKSGKIVIAGCTDYFPDALRIPLINGIYRVRICYGKLNTLDETGLEGEDYYEVYMWKTEFHSQLKILKK
ncbi:hypothetical protein SAMN05443634_104170 [Chishuiella changwenlii]|uniref:Uncharacterized protein n=1 Tax=Chishuiella changwenlii TaxID=1434701 RepID=A0A1M6W5C3_9FLAO|nr:hypothetical protein [Chishuiella changwenlii]GGE88938.1 hypothetical protein GCM10010984_03230 [Chishuiella changwenlii]SHK88937.1 hypothetical protein SAMN05443634_104170 [Chishuiella changwenlii]